MFVFERKKILFPLELSYEKKKLSKNRKKNTLYFWNNKKMTIEETGDLNEVLPKFFCSY